MAATAAPALRSRTARRAAWGDAPSRARNVIAALLGPVDADVARAKAFRRVLPEVRLRFSTSNQQLGAAADEADFIATQEHWTAMELVLKDHPWRPLFLAMLQRSATLRDLTLTASCGLADCELVSSVRSTALRSLTLVVDAGSSAAIFTALGSALRSPNCLLRSLAIERFCGERDAATLEAAIVLFAGMAQCRTLRSLRLAGGSRQQDDWKDPAVAIALGTVLSWVPLEQLHVEDAAWVGNAGGARVARTLADAGAKLRKLSLVRCCMGHEAAEAVAELLQDEGSLLEDISIAGNPAIGATASAMIAMAAKRCNKLHSLDLRATALPLSTCKTLAELLARSDTKLAVLRLARNAIGANGATAIAQQLAHNHVLRELDLAWCDLGAVDIAAAVESSHLGAIDLEGNVGVDAVRLASNRRLRFLGLARCGLAAEAAEELGRAIGRSRLLRVDLEGNGGLGDAGAAKLIEGIGSGKMCVRMGDCGVSDAGRTVLEAAVARMPDLEVHWSPQ